tara:strand:+ start:193 stop:549 length:357 start_codon:yes stop_codon:yes gene_type:complete
MGAKFDYPRLRAADTKDRDDKIFDDYLTASKKLTKKFADRGTSGDAELKKQKRILADQTVSKMKKSKDAMIKDLDLAKKYGKDAYKARSFGTGKKAGGKVMKMRGGGLATRGTSFTIR